MWMLSVLLQCVYLLLFQIIWSQQQFELKRFKRDFTPTINNTKVANKKPALRFPDPLFIDQWYLVSILWITFNKCLCLVVVRNKKLFLDNSWTTLCLLSIQSVILFNIEVLMTLLIINGIMNDRNMIINKSKELHSFSAEYVLVVSIII